MGNIVSSCLCVGRFLSHFYHRFFRSSEYLLPVSSSPRYHNLETQPEQSTECSSQYSSYSNRVLTPRSPRQTHRSLHSISSCQPSSTVSKHSRHLRLPWACSDTSVRLPQYQTDSNKQKRKEYQLLSGNQLEGVSSNDPRASVGSGHAQPYRNPNGVTLALCTNLWQSALDEQPASLLNGFSNKAVVLTSCRGQPSMLNQHDGGRKTDIRPFRKSGPRKLHIMLCGLRNAGKSALLYRMKLNAFIFTVSQLRIAFREIYTSLFP
eukprot:GHVQ01023812.1.p1 GENE.GHVQ01023812.1~~GHVQ01023812.1.p1  ORF type:complete len:264 (-),score=5.41 GHVQ01023812.1:650-1441(-)